MEQQKVEGGTEKFFGQLAAIAEAGYTARKLLRETQYPDRPKIPAWSELTKADVKFHGQKALVSILNGPYKVTPAEAGSKDPTALEHYVWTQTVHAMAAAMNFTVHTGSAIPEVE